MNIEIQKGTSKRIDFVIRDDDYNIVDITGKTGLFTAYLEQPNGNNANVIEKAISITSGPDGECSVLLDNNDTDLKVFVYNFYVKINYDTDDDRIFESGYLNLTGDDTERIQNIKNKYKFMFQYYQLKPALDYAQKQVKKYAYHKVVRKSNSQETSIAISNYVADSNFDNSIDVTDIELIEYQECAPYTINSLSSNISNVILDHPSGNTIVQLDGAYPSDATYTTQLTYYQMKKKYSELEDDIKLLEEYYLILYLIDNLEAHQLQRGITNKTINNVSIEFDKNSIDDYRILLRKQINNQIIKIKPINLYPININKLY